MAMGNNGFKVLIVDDSSINRELLRLMLTAENETDAVDGQEPYVVELAETGIEALEKVDDIKPDLILLDLMMPGLSGFDVLDRLKESESTQSTPVIIISGLADEEHEEKGFKYGAVDYISRPFHRSVVLARIRTHRRIVEQLRLIENLSLIDPLTSIPNRRCFDFRIEEVWGVAARCKEPVSVLVIDVDHFKIYNDTYGHQQGDVALKAVAGAIVMALGRSSDMAFRCGGEEFTAILVGNSPDGALIVAERIRSNVEKAAITGLTGGAAKGVTVSIGVACETPKSDIKIIDLIKSADMALYSAKETGRNRVTPAWVSV